MSRPDEENGDPESEAADQGARESQARRGSHRKDSAAANDPLGGDGLPAPRDVGLGMPANDWLQLVETHIIGPLVVPIRTDVEPSEEHGQDLASRPPSRPHRQPRRPQILSSNDTRDGSAAPSPPPSSPPPPPPPRRERIRITSSEATPPGSRDDGSDPDLEITHERAQPQAVPQEPARRRTLRRTRRPVATHTDERAVAPPTSPDPDERRTARRRIVTEGDETGPVVVPSGGSVASDSTPTADATHREGAVIPFVVEPSSFGSAAWWSRDWWRIPPDGGARDIACDAGTVGTLATVSVSLRGHKHRLAAEPNDDAFATRLGATADNAQWLVCCVCDGVGSAARAHEGAAFASAHFADAIATLCTQPEWNDGEPTQEALDRLVVDTRNSLLERFDVDVADAAQFETTLTFVAIETSKTPDEGRKALFGWVGDSPAFLLHDAAWVDVAGAATDAQDTGISSTRTAGLLTHGQLEGVVASRLAEQDVVMLCSDGIGSFVLDGSRELQLGMMLAELLNEPVDVLHAVNLMSFDMRSADDDRTAAIIWQLPSPDAGPNHEKQDPTP